jgi:hypothetical protein
LVDIDPTHSKTWLRGAVHAFGNCGGLSDGINSLQTAIIYGFPAIQIDSWILVAVNISLRLRINRQFNVVAVYATICDILACSNKTIVKTGIDNPSHLPHPAINST